MTSAPDPKVRGAVQMPGKQLQRTAPRRRWSSRELHVELYKNSARLYGARIVELLGLAGVHQRQYDTARRRWLVPLNRVNDVATVAQWHQRRRVAVTEATR
jgi:hypothetical protein